ncbi:TIR domain-containing protein [Halomonas titanicae]|uniref:TIR domain-containing protein n=1 Tax=Vreelandella titanicae TaxID=664683 RepID=UPI001F3CCEFC|nr:TIR domain-containing protein [Halomonas titanicae]MCE7518230.1 TIR domain-containing protein [Halomonas titanicae]
MAIVRRKCFITYHHADQDEVSQFVRTFDHVKDAFIARGLGREMSDNIIQSTNTDYVMNQIRQLYLGNSTVTLVMLGKCTWARRYVDWEIQSSLRQGEITTPNGLVAIKLPSFEKDQKILPERLSNNLLQNGSHEDCYARCIEYPRTTEQLVNAIEAAYQRRTTHRKWIVNPRDRMSYNRKC